MFSCPSLTCELPSFHDFPWVSSFSKRQKGSPQIQICLSLGVCRQRHPSNGEMFFLSAVVKLLYRCHDRAMGKDLPRSHMKKMSQKFTVITCDNMWQHDWKASTVGSQRKTAKSTTGKGWQLHLICDNIITLNFSFTSDEADISGWQPVIKKRPSYGLYLTSASSCGAVP